MRVRLAARKIFSLVLITLSLCAALAPTSALCTPRTLTLVSINDIHSHLADDAAGGGIARIASVVREYKEQDPGNTVIAQIGDINEGALYHLYGGFVEMRMLDAAGFDLGTLGNHEFDKGAAPMLTTVSYARMPLVVSNLYALEGGSPVPGVPLYVKTLKNGLKVGFFGLVTPQLAAVAGGGSQYRVADPVGEAQKRVHELRALGCDVVVALSHCGLDEDIRIAKHVRGIHYIAGGHSHTAMKEAQLVAMPSGWGTWTTMIGQAGCYGRYVSRAQIALDGFRLDTARSAYALVPMSAGTPEDPDVKKTLFPYRWIMDEKLGVAVATLASDLDGRRQAVRTGESAIGNFVADALLWKAGNAAQIAMVSSGGIRGDRVFAAGAFTLGDLYTIFPYGDHLCYVTLTGAEIRQTLEISASALSAPGETRDESTRPSDGGFLQLAGLRVALDLSQPPALVDNQGALRQKGSRVTDVAVKKQDGTFEPLEEGRTYTVVALDWLAKGGDKHVVFAQKWGQSGGAAPLNGGDVDALGAYARHLGQIAPQIEDRIEIKP